MLFVCRSLYSFSIFHVSHHKLNSLIATSYFPLYVLSYICELPNLVTPSTALYKTTFKARHKAMNANTETNQKYQDFKSKVPDQSKVPGPTILSQLCTESI